MRAPPSIYSPVEYWIEYEFDSVVENMGLIAQEEMSRYLFWVTSGAAFGQNKTTICKFMILAEIGDILVV